MLLFIGTLACFSYLSLQLLPDNDLVVVNTVDSLRVPLANPDQQADASSSSSSFDLWMRENPDTPGARFVDLMKTYMHGKPGSEGDRIKACSSGEFAHCFAGTVNFTPKPGMEDEELEKETKLPLVKDGKTVYQARRFFNTDRLIRTLGTDLACLPLLLASAAVKDGVVVELGPFVGLSSRCMGMGLQTTGREGEMYVFDTWAGARNFKDIVSSMPWIKTEHPEYSPDNDSFLWLWKMVMKDAYPSAKAYQGWITPKTVKPETWDNKKIDVLSIDSIKSWSSWNEQLGGLGDTFLEKGAIFAAMDFTYTDQPNFVYACLRDYLQPVYTSWHRGEHWIFVVLKTIPFELPTTCMKKIMAGKKIPSQDVTDRIERQLKDDLDFMQSLGSDPVHHEFLDSQTKLMIDGMVKWKIGNGSPTAKFWSRFA